MESLAVKYRPAEFSSLTGQKSIVKILERQIETDNIKNSYIFSGSSGCGKTTSARIFANRINKGVGAPIEIDAASNNGVEKMRELVQSASERSLDSTYKVIIIDECHTLTSQSWQALLKIIEETPKYTVFIFCTTDPQKIPPTIVNRCQRFNFCRLSSLSIEDRLRYICEQEKFTNYEECIKYISKISKGQMRDAISNLEKVSDYDTNLSIENTLTALGGFSFETFFKLTNALIDGNEKDSLEILYSFYNEGNDLRLFVDEYLSFIIDILKYILFKDFTVIGIPESMQSEIDFITTFENVESYYNYLLDMVLNMKNMVKQDTNIFSTLQVLFLKICRCEK